MISIKDLIIKLANGEPVPKKIKVWNNEYEYRKGAYTETLEYYHIGTGISLNKAISFNEKDLNQEVIILEEDEFEDIEELKIDGDFGGDFLINDEGNRCYISSHNKTIVNRINKVIKNQKKIIERLENGTLD